MEISWIDRVGNDKVLRRVKGHRNILRKSKGRISGLVTSCVGTVV